MAGYCTGVVVSWRGTDIGEVTEYRFAAGGSLPLARGSTVAGSTPWALDAGTVELASVSTAAMNLSEYGTKGLLSFVGGGLTLTTKAICQTLDVSAKVNDVYRLKSVFRIVQE
jgi:hypothetical protein